jgi:cytoskeleton-associated protein 5
MAEEDEGGPLANRVLHEKWKIRSAAYEELEKMFKLQTDETSAVYSEYGKQLGAFVTDKNPPCQEKALDALAIYLSRASKGFIEKYCTPLLYKIIESTFTQRPKNKEKAVECLFLYIEMGGSPESLITALLEGTSHKAPKIAAISVATIKSLIAAFGARVFPLKPIVHALPQLFEKKENSIRNETLQLVVELNRWIGPGFLAQLDGIRSAQHKELEAAISTTSETSPPQPTRQIRTAHAFGGNSGAVSHSATKKHIEEETNDPLEFVEAKEVISKLGGEFWNGLEATKWSDRRDALIILLNIVSGAPKLVVSDDYTDLCRALRKVIDKVLNIFKFTFSLILSFSHSLSFFLSLSLSLSTY